MKRILFLIFLAGCASAPPPAEIMSYHLARIEYVGSYVDPLSQKLCPRGSVYISFQDIKTLDRGWICSFPWGKTGDLISLVY